MSCINCSVFFTQGCLHRIAEAFNKEFEEVARLKQAEIARIREKNVRILKIVHQLQLEEELVQPSLLPEEQPEEMLAVQVGERSPLGPNEDTCCMLSCALVL